VFENRVLRIHGPHREELAGGWRILHIEELHNLNYSSNIVGAIRSRMVRLVGHVTLLREMRNYTKFWLEILKGNARWKT